MTTVNKLLQSLSSLLRFQAKSESELIGLALEHTVILTNSKFGFIGFVDQSETVMHTHVYSAKAMEDCRTDYALSFDISKGGLWAEPIRQRKPVIYNDYTSALTKKGCPIGHVSLKRFLGIPILFDGRVPLVVGLANSEDEYTLSNCEELIVYLESLWSVINNLRLRSQVAHSDRLASMGLLASGIAHEINNPLTFVLFGLDSLLKDLPELKHKDAVCMLEQVKTIYEGAVRIKNIVRGLGTFSKVYDNKVTGTNIARSIDIALSMVFNEIKYKARVIKNYGSLPLIRANEGKLSQVFLNLFINAIHAIPEGDSSKHWIRITSFVADLTLVVHVEDSGHGIKQEYLRAVFEPFFTTKTTDKGTGLGLSINKSIIEEYGGTIEVSNAQHGGACFTIKFPIVETEESSDLDEEIPSKDDLFGKILVVDDEESIRQVLKIILKGHVVLGVENITAAKEILTLDADFDVIICDVMMRNGTGVDLHKWLVENSPELADRVVFITGGVFAAQVHAYFNSITNAKVDKPFDLKALRDVIKDCILRKRGKI